MPQMSPLYWLIMVTVITVVLISTKANMNTTPHAPLVISSIPILVKGYIW